MTMPTFAPNRPRDADGWIQANDPRPESSPPFPNGALKDSPLAARLNLDDFAIEFHALTVTEGAILKRLRSLDRTVRSDLLVLGRGETAS
jgi:hypothetical protein